MTENFSSIKDRLFIAVFIACCKTLFKAENSTLESQMPQFLTTGDVLTEVKHVEGSGDGVTRGLELHNDLWLPYIWSERGCRGRAV